MYIKLFNIIYNVCYIFYIILLYKVCHKISLTVQLQYNVAIFAVFPQYFQVAFLWFTNTDLAFCIFNFIELLTK